jgi:hypothetical protein
MDMLKFRIVTAGAVLALAVSAAAAQGSDSDAPGKPVSLLQMLTKPDKKPTPHAQAVAKRLSKKTTRWAKKFHSDTARAAAEPEETEPAPAPAATDTAPAASNPVQTASDPAQAASDTAPPHNIWAAGAPALSGTPSDTAPPADSLDHGLRELVVDGRTVQVAAADRVNALDLAATDANPAADPIARVRSASAAVGAFAQRDDSNKSRDTWFEELLATLGGALAAGSVAWFLIAGAAPRRTYG